MPGSAVPSIAPEKLLRAMLLQAFYGPDEIGFTWAGYDEMDEVTGVGAAELLDDGSLQIEFEYHNGDKAVLKAVRQPSSVAC